MKREFLSVKALPAWAKLNGIEFHGVAIQQAPNGESGAPDRGSAVYATEAHPQATNADDGHPTEPHEETLIEVPPDMVLSLSLVEDYAKSDRWLREVIDAMEEYGKTARGAILIFLLLQITYDSQTAEEYDGDHVKVKPKIGVSNPWSEYIKFLPASVPLPTFYNEEEQSLLYGTSLQDAVEAKMTSLEKEFENLRVKTESIPWCQQHWWDVETGRLTFDDWKAVDALYRSRALDLPGTGHAMVPCVDMANHASGEDTIALYETDKEGNALLQLRVTKSLSEGDEVTITYGDEKGASEMIFSYGFIEDTMKDARQLFLPLDIPEDDPLKQPKRVFCKDAPGVRLFTQVGKSAGEEATYWPVTGWESPFIWWSCVNEEDGLDFVVLQTKEGHRELRATWKGSEIGSVSSPETPSLKDILEKDALWDVFQLRATVMLQERLRMQLSLLENTEDVFLGGVHHDESGDQTGIRSGIYNTIKVLRHLETVFLRSAVRTLEQDRERLMQSNAVQTYFTQQQAEGIEEDFS